MHVETAVIPPEVSDDDDEFLPSSRLSINWLGPDEIHRDAAVQLMGATADDPEQFAEAALRVALALGALLGADHSWALMQKLAAYDGTPPR